MLDGTLPRILNFFYSTLDTPRQGV